MTKTEYSPAQSRAHYLPVFPLELWDVIIDYLRQEETVQSLSRLSQTCPLLRARIEPLLYQPVRLCHSESGARLARTIGSRPDLAPLICEIQHKEDCGFEHIGERYFKFYQMAVTLPNLETLFLRNNLRPLDTSRWASESDLQGEREQWQDRTFEKNYTGDLSLRDFRKFGFGPLGHSSFSPPSDDDLAPAKFLLEDFRLDKSLFAHALLQTPTGLPALRVCHIGSDDNLGDVSRTQRLPHISESIFFHPGLRKLCITGCMFVLRDDSSSKPPTHSTPLEDLTLLNCAVSPRIVESLVSWARELKWVTIRAGEGLYARSDRPDISYAEAVRDHCDSLHTMDVDSYWGFEDETDFYELHNLKHLTTTLSTLVGSECHELDVEDNCNLPKSLESLTIRYDETKSWVLSAIYELVKSEKLPNLRRFACEVPETMEELPSINPDKKNPPCKEICQEGNTWHDKFQELNVELSMIAVPYPNKMPRYNRCACENLDFYHRLPSHPHGAGLPNPWDDDDFAGVSWEYDDDVEDMLEHAQNNAGADGLSDFGDNSDFDEDVDADDVGNISYQLE